MYIHLLLPSSPFFCVILQSARLEYITVQFTSSRKTSLDSLGLGTVPGPSYPVLLDPNSALRLSSRSQETFKPSSAQLRC